MAAISEVGHAKNVANFQFLITFVTSFGTDYNPSYEKLQIPKLQSLLDLATDSIHQVIVQRTHYNNAINNRVTAFQHLRSHCTRIINAFDATDASDLIVQDAKTINRKIQGKRAPKSKTSTPPPTATPTTTISSSQQSYDLLIHHFLTLIAILESHPGYAPFEPDLQIATLHTKATDLTLQNTAVSTANTSLSNARIHRNKLLYADKEGIISISAEVKKYIKSVYGATSPQFQEINGIRFRNFK